MMMMVMILHSATQQHKLQRADGDNMQHRLSREQHHPSLPFDQMHCCGILRVLACSLSSRAQLQKSHRFSSIYQYTLPFLWDAAFHSVMPFIVISILLDVHVVAVVVHVVLGVGVGLLVLTYTIHTAMACQLSRRCFECSNLY